MAGAELVIGFDDVRAAAERLQGIAHRTPVMTSSTLDGLVGAEVYLKCESFQRTGSFKVRGAYNALAQHVAKQQRDGGKGMRAVAFSLGNHAQGLGYAGRRLGVPVLILMPNDAPKAKVEATRGYGVEIQFYDLKRDDREELARALAEEPGNVLVHPFDDAQVMAGQGTIALELLQHVEDLDAIVAPLGGGGLMSGIAVAARAIRPSIRLIGVEPEGGNDWWLSRQAGRRTKIDGANTIADGLRSPIPGELTFPIVQRLVDDIVLVSDDDIRETMRFLMLRMKLVVEASGATPLAAIMSGKIAMPGKRIGVVITGGNVDPQRIAQILG